VAPPLLPPPLVPGAGAPTIRACTASWRAISLTSWSACCDNCVCTITGTCCSSRCAQLARQPSAASAAAAALAAGGTSAGSSAETAGAAEACAWRAAAARASSSAAWVATGLDAAHSAWTA
jgi:hypothetical protein